VQHGKQGVLKKFVIGFADFIIESVKKAVYPIYFVGATV
jgi:hypothetical protein